ncbi:MAG: ABC transporter permease [Kiritimatiellia bacterium]|jgi:lipopolysaccharide transport system permease protein
METIIEPTQSLFRINWREIREYRDLLVLLARRDITVVYKQTILGPVWFFIQPIITALVFTVIFGKVAKISTGGIPHFVFYMSGTVMWNYFSSVLNGSASSLVGNAGLFSKVYFPRLIVPFSSVLSNFAHFLLNMAIFVAFYLYFYFTGAPLQPTWWILMLPLLILYTALTGLGFGLWVAALTTKYRDMRFALPFILQMWMYATPIVYPASGVVEPVYRWILWANPMSAAVELNRFFFTGVSSISLMPVLVGVAVMAFVLVSGVVVFNWVQRNFVDTI